MTSRDTSEADAVFLEYCEKHLENPAPIFSREQIAHLRKLAGAPPLLANAPDKLRVGKTAMKILISNARERLKARKS